ncbi:MAG: hypothetical protein R2746_02595 [Acidimicrobiales bacterium]
MSSAASNPWNTSSAAWSPRASVPCTNAVSTCSTTRPASPFSAHTRYSPGSTPGIASTSQPGGGSKLGVVARSTAVVPMATPTRPGTAAPVASANVAVGDAGHHRGARAARWQPRWRA